MEEDSDIHDKAIAYHTSALVTFEKDLKKSNKKGS